MSKWRVCSVLSLICAAYYLLTSLWHVTSHLSRVPRILDRVVQDPSFSLQLTNATKIIVMATLFRSGSTFLGELFNQVRGFLKV